MCLDFTIHFFPHFIWQSKIYKVLDLLNYSGVINPKLYTLFEKTERHHTSYTVCGHLSSYLCVLSGAFSWFELKIKENLNAAENSDVLDNYVLFGST